MCQLRHTAPAKWLRWLAYRTVVGNTEWPLKFKACRTPPKEEDTPNLYFHLPFCRTLCPHCPYLKRKYQAEQASKYSQAILSELGGWLAVTPDHPLESLYFGGGTPALLLEGIAEILSRLRPRINRNTAVGMELHPSDITPELVSTLRQFGVNRVSLGVESLQSEVLNRLGRKVGPEEVLHSVKLLVQGGFDCVDTNLIYGADGQNPAGVLHDAVTLLELGVDQISAYPLFSFRHTETGVCAGWRRFHERDRLARDLRELCVSRGFTPTSVWSFNRIGRPAYTTVTLETFRGFGAGAASRGLRSFRFHTFDIDEYMKPDGTRMATALAADERFFKSHWLYWKLYQLRVPTERYTEIFDSSLDSDFRLLRIALKALGWMEERSGEWRINPRGADWIHRLQQLYSLSWIDLFWGKCQREAWPEEITLL